LFKLSCLVAICPGGSRIGVNQVVWDAGTNTLYAEPDQLLDQDARYLLVDTNGIRDTSGERIDSNQFHDVLHSGQSNDPAETAYRQALLDALDQLYATGMPPGEVADASLFTTESATAEMEKIRDQLEAATPAPADFLLGTNGERTVFPFPDVASISWRRQDSTAPSFTTVAIQLKRLRVVPGAIGTIAYGHYLSPDYENGDGVIPTVGTLTGTPQVQSVNDVYFDLFLPAGPEPPGGWPVVVAGHGAGGGGKDNGNVPVSVAATLAAHGLATIAINAVGNGGGPLGTLTVTRTDATSVTLPSGGRNVDRNGNGVYDHPAGSLPEGLSTLPTGPDAIVWFRDGFRQTVVDMMQLVREIEVGIDLNGDSIPDLNPSRIYYLGNSQGGIVGTLFTALEPQIRAAVLGAAGGPPPEIARLNSIGPFRALMGQLLADRTPSLTNLSTGCGIDPVNPGNCAFPFDENLPPICTQPCDNTVPGAAAIQNEIDRIVWATESSDPAAYAPHLRLGPLAGVTARPVLITFAQDDPIVPNTTTETLLCAGGLGDRTIFFRALDAYNGNPPGGAADIHEFAVSLTPEGTTYALETQASMATFLASDGQTTLDPDGPGPLFETPFAGVLPCPKDGS
jgi:pimeloyl-ACP methyl ester carboxylesterase